MPTDAERRGRTSWRVLRHRDFSVFWSAALVSNTGTWMQTIAVPFVIYQMTHSTTWLGVSAVATFLPGAITGPIGGTFADRHSRQRILLLTQTFLMVVAFALYGVYTAGVSTPGMIVGLVLISGAVGGVNIAAWQAFITQLVEGDELVDAVRLNSMQFTGARAFGPALAGIVLQAAGASAAFLVNALTFLLVLGALVVIRPRAQDYSATDATVAQEFRDGLHRVRSRTGLFLPVLMIGVVSLLATSVLQLAPAIAKSMFGVGRGAYGLLVASFGIGAVVGAILVTLIADRATRSLVARVSIVGAALAEVVLGLAPGYTLGVAAMFLMGLMYVLHATSLNTGVQARVEDAYRARVVAIYLCALQLGVPVGALVEGKLASIVPLRSVIVGAGITLLCFGIFTMLRYDRLRPLDQSLLDAQTEELLAGRPAVAGADGS